MGLTQFDEKIPIDWVTTLDDSNTDQWAGLAQSYVLGNFRIDGLTAMTDSVTDVTLEIARRAGSSPLSTSQPFARFIVPAGAGMGTVPLLDILPLVTAAASPYLICFPGEQFTIRATATIAADKTVWLHQTGGEL